MVQMVAILKNGSHFEFKNSKNELPGLKQLEIQLLFDSLCQF